MSINHMIKERKRKSNRTNVVLPDDSYKKLKKLSKIHIRSGSNMICFLIDKEYKELTK